MMRHATFVVILTALAAGVSAADTSAIIYAEDSLQLAVTLRLSDDSPETTLLVLLPMMGHTRASYDQFLASLRDYVEADTGLSMPHVLSMDMRGHGQSVQMGKTKLDWRRLQKAEFGKYPGDAESAVRWALEQTTGETPSFSIEDIVVVGASIGANTAIMISDAAPGITKVAMLSPGEDYRGLKPADALKSFAGEVLIFAGKGDTYSARSSRKLAELREKDTSYFLFPGTDHGTDLINGHSEAMDWLVKWVLDE